MKRLLSAAMLLNLMLFSGCLKQDYSLCAQQDNFTLLFTYQDPGAADLFANNISSVDVVLYDKNHDFAGHKRVEKTDLNYFQGVRFSVPPGDYYVVCWGNVGANSTFSGISERSKLSGCYLQTVSTECGCPLYYAPFKNITDYQPSATPDYSSHKVTVPSGKSVEVELNFIRAHRTLNIYVNRYDDPAEGADPQLDITATNLAAKYDFLLRIDPARRSYSRSTNRVSTPDGVMVMSQIYTPYCEIRDDINIYFAKSSDGTQICAPVNLRQYIESRTRATDDNYSPHEVNIVVSFMADGSVGIVMPDWDESQVNPVW